MNIVDWFDIHDHDHLRAWVHIGEKGVWPDGFIPDDMKFDPHWQIQIALRMAKAWVSSVV